MKNKHGAVKICFFLCFLSLFSLKLAAQAFTVSGRVTDEAGKGLDGASVQEKGTKNIVVTKDDGVFQINVLSGKAKLVISFVGSEKMEVAVEDKSQLSVSLKLLNDNMTDVVVVGYATVKKKDVTGAVSGINQKDIRSRPVDNALQAMQGKVAGVDISSNERPGQLGTIAIRGVRSLNASNSPLFVVDGIPLSTGGIEYLNPNDIESIDVLKDASATAIFGSRGANGVVIVTTKQGKVGKTQINVYSSSTFEKVVDWSPGMTATEYIEFRRWAYYYSNPALFPRGDKPTIANDRTIFLATSDPSAWANINNGWASGTWDGSKVATTDWKGMVSQTGITTDHTLSVGGGTNKIKAYASFGYLNNTGTSIGQKFTRYTGKTSADIQATDWFLMGGTVNITYGIQEFGQSAIAGGSFVGSPAPSIYESARRLYPYAVPYDSLGNRILYPGGDVAFKTVADEWNYTQDQRVTLRAFGSLYSQLDFGKMAPVLKGLRYRVNFGPDFSNFRGGLYIDGQSTSSSGVSRAALNKNQTYSWTLDNLIYYDKAIGKHNVGLTLLQSATKFVTEGSAIDANNIPFSSQKWNALSQSNILSTSLNSYNSFLTQRQIASYMARLNYGFDDKYLLTVSVRSDGSSKLAEGNKFDLFPSAALAWRINHEKFMENLGWVNDLKFRVGVGVTGNSAIDDNVFATRGTAVPLFYPFGNTTTRGSLPSAILPNEYLGWEKTTQYNLGLDFSLFKNRVSGSIDAYRSITSDLLMSRGLPSITGFASTFQNIGKTANKGIDISLTTINVSNKRFQWVSSINASWQKEEIVSLANGKQDDITNLWFIGQPISVIYGVKADGVWKPTDTANFKKFNANGNNFSAGSVRPVDQNGDNKIDFNNDRTIVGYTRPRWILGITNSFNYRGIELSFLVYGRLNYMMDTGGEPQVGRSNQRKINYYTENNTNSAYQKPIYTTGTGDLFSGSLGYQKASFLKLRNISAAYNFSGKLVKALHLSNLRFYFQALNPAMLYSQIKFLDMDVAAPTSNRGFTVGINASF